LASNQSSLLLGISIDHSFLPLLCVVEWLVLADTWYMLHLRGPFSSMMPPLLHWLAATKVKYITPLMKVKAGVLDTDWHFGAAAYTAYVIERALV